MQVLEATVAANPWPLRRERAAELAERYPYAAEMLRLYQALTVVQEAACRIPSPQNIAAYAAEQILPAVIDVTVEAGPRPLRDGVVALFASENMEGVIQRWLDQQPLNPFETYLARASASPLLEAMSPSSFPSSSDSLHCPHCGGLPQLSYFAVSGEALVSGPRYLVCSLCATNWIFSRMMCAGCGESDGTKLPIYQEHEQLPHARADGCQTCRKYLLTFDLRRDTRAVPVVDEIAALPLDLYARDQGLTKITPNLMGN
jgi:FdhE protein